MNGPGGELVATIEGNPVREPSRDEQHELERLLARVPLTSLPWIVLVVVGAGTLALIALVFVVVRGGALAPAVRESVTLAMFAAGFVAFSASGLIPRRKKYRDHFQRMLSLTPLIVWTYTDAEWLRWQRSAMTMAYGRTSNTRPAKVCVLVLLFGLIPGVMLWLSRPVVPFLVYWGGGIFLLSLPVLLYFLYWRHLRRSWEQRPSEARIFATGVFFHHKYIDWTEASDQGVAVSVEAATDDRPITLLRVETEARDAKLAPHLPALYIPIPDSQLPTAHDLASALSQNVMEDGEVDGVQSDTNEVDE